MFAGSTVHISGLFCACSYLWGTNENSNGYSKLSMFQLPVSLLFWSIKRIKKKKKSTPAW